MAKTNIVVSRLEAEGVNVAVQAHSKHSYGDMGHCHSRPCRLGWPETRRDDRLHVSERLLNLDEVQRHYLLSLEERLGVHLSALDSDYDERNVTTMLTLT
jgi:hypothetical protein